MRKRNALLRLTLNRETLRHLNSEEMSAAQGGASERICRITQSCFVSYCNCPTNETCPSHVTLGTDYGV